MVGDDQAAATSRYRVLVDRFQRLEESHAQLREEFDELLIPEKRKTDEVATSWGFFNEGTPYRSVLESMGHAVHVCTASSGEIIYWNHSAENLYGWKDYEVLGRRDEEFLVAEEFHNPYKKIMERLASGQSWSGQFPIKQRSGEIFMAMVTKSPLYEDGELAGFITVSSDATIFNSINPENIRKNQDRGKLGGLNMKRIRWHPPRPQIAPMPQIASSVSNLASKLLLRRHGDDTDTEKSCTVEEKPISNFHNGKGMTSRSSGKDESAFEFAHASKIAAKVLAKLHIRETGNCSVDDGRNGPNGASNKSLGDDERDELHSPGVPYQHTTGSRGKEESLSKTNSSFAAKSAYANVYENTFPNASEEFCGLGSSRDRHDCCALSKLGELSPRLDCQDVNELEPDDRQFCSFGESIGSHESSSSKGDNESNGAVDCEIRWEDLQLGQEIGQGSYAIVYRGLWNGSDVAVKVYFGNEYSEDTLQSYQKEIDIMKKLRHPNVLLFMGAISSQERLAIVTEFLPRGSLFKILHKNSQTLDIKRRLRMALDIARGMNYLHYRNPPIVHRDLKSSNLLVDRNWTVKVGDFGLSRLKNATYLTAKSGSGTPQWMAPEVLRNEPSNEKSDVFSFGVILWELMALAIPWNNLNSLEVVGVVGFMDRRLELPEGLDPQVASIIRDCWKSDPNQRISFKDLIQRISSLICRDSGTPAIRKS
ncbi:Serine/threonine-protein kinase [Melia azedarach]|uniref:Serine/threonine-protein kinase n=1 Tax=Melia azedarach TaxID=155640 RepID=A0ACC1XP92_MELAZ|nr:Serine/threonine-protein kinase [Melia azedarach]